jgi:hypothetical protein
MIAKYTIITIASFTLSEVNSYTLFEITNLENKYDSKSIKYFYVDEYDVVTGDETNARIEDKVLKIFKHKKLMYEL